MAWLVAIAEQARRSLAEKSLLASDFVPYFPGCFDTAYRCGRRVDKWRPLFGRYFFVMMNDNWRRVPSARGVSDILLNRSEEKPLLVRDEIVDEIKERSVEVTKDLIRGFWRGQQVVPKSGHLFGQIGKFDRFALNGREIAFFNILGVETKVEFAPGTLEKAAAEVPIVKRRRKGKRRFDVTRHQDTHRETLIGH